MNIFIQVKSCINQVLLNMHLVNCKFQKKVTIGNFQSKQIQNLRCILIRNQFLFHYLLQSSAVKLMASKYWSATSAQLLQDNSTYDSLFFKHKNLLLPNRCQFEKLWTIVFHNYGWETFSKTDLYKCLSFYW